MTGINITVRGPRRIDLKIPLQCPGCGRKMETKMRNSRPGQVITCSCGSSIRLDGDDPRKIQKALDDLLDTFHKMGR